jgi:glycosyltransferase involved in cell wall biosynthesis
MDISVIIPVFNATATLPRQLEALAGQDFQGTWSIVIADNGSTDDLAACVERCGTELACLPPCRVIDAGRLAGASYARTIALLYAPSDLIAFCDADDIVCPGWLTAIVEGLATYDLVTGPLTGISDHDLTSRDAPWLFEHQVFDDRQSRSRAIGGGYMGNNCGYRRRALSGFAPDFLGAEDAAVALRAVTNGYEGGWADGARILYRQRTTPRTAFRKAFAIAVGHVQLGREFPDLVVVPSRDLRALGWLLLHAPDLLRRKGRVRVAKVAGHHLGLRLERLLPGLFVGVVRARRARQTRRAR